MKISLVCLIGILTGGLCLLGCTGEFEPEKIRLKEAFLSQIENEISGEKRPEITRPPFLQLFDINIPIVAVMPIAENSNNSDLNLLLNDVNNLVAYLMSQNTEIGLLSPYLIKKLAGTENDSERIFNAITKLEGVQFYIRSELIYSSTNVEISCTLFDARSSASVLELRLPTENPDETISELINLVPDFHRILSTDFSGISIKPDLTYRAASSFIRGLNAQFNNEREIAESYFFSSIMEDSTFAQPYFQLIPFYFNNFFEENRAYLPELLKYSLKYQDQLTEKEKIILSGYQNFSFQKFQEAQSSFKSFTTRFPDQINGYIGLVRSLLALNQPESALEAIEPVRDILVDDVQLLLLQSEIYRSLGMFEESMLFIEQVTRKDQGSVYPEIEQARLLISWGRLRSAETVLKDILQKDDGNFQALELLSELYFSMMDFEKSLETNRKALLALDDNQLIYSIDLNFLQFLANLYLGKYETASEIAKNILTSPEEDFYGEKNPLFSSYIALIRQDAGAMYDWSDLDKSFFDTKINDLFLYENLIILSENNDYGEINVLLDNKLKEIAEINAFQYEVLDNLRMGIRSIAAGDHNGAIARLESVQKYEFNPIVSYYLAKAYLETGKSDKAEHQIIEFYKLMNLKEFETAYSLPKFYLLQAQIFEQNNQLDEAKALYNSYLELWQNADDLFTPARIVTEKISAIG